jgi:hypothetical protein
MQRFNHWFVIGAVCLLLSGCVISISPDPGKPVVVNMGETKNFTVKYIKLGSSGSMPMIVSFIGWEREEGPYRFFTDSEVETESYTPTNEDEVGNKKIYCKVAYGAKVFQSFPYYLPIFMKDIVWDVIVPGVKFTTDTIAVGQAQELKAVAYPEGDYGYEWYLDSQALGSGQTLKLSPEMVQSGYHNFEVRAFKDGQPYDSYARTLFVAFAAKGTLEDEQFTSMALTGDGGCIITLNSVYPKDYYDHCLIVKYNSLGEIEKEMPFGRPSSTSLDNGIYYNANSVRQAADGGYVVAGMKRLRINSETYNDVWVCRLSSAGVVQWEKVYGGESEDWAKSIVQTADNGYIAAGTSYSDEIPGVVNNGGMDAYVIKLNAAGAVEWQRMWGGSLDETANSIIQASDGSYVVAGTSEDRNNHYKKDGFVFKMDALGNILWQRTFSEAEINITANSVRQTLEGGYIVAGSSDHDWCVRKLDMQGNPQWIHTYGDGSGYEDRDSAFSIEQTSDGGYVVAGAVQIHYGSARAYAIKIDSAGLVQWEKMYGDPSAGISLPIRSDSESSVISISLLPGGGYLLGGNFFGVYLPYVMFMDNDNDAFLLKVDEDGNMS